MTRCSGYVLISLIDMGRPDAGEVSFNCLKFHALSALIQLANDMSVFGKRAL